ncbi:MAG: hypothetical protein ACK56O_14160, partial [Dolichospermum sp.]
STVIKSKLLMIENELRTNFDLYNHLTSRLALKIVVMIREQGTGNREQGTGNRKQGTGNRLRRERQPNGFG